MRLFSMNRYAAVVGTLALFVSLSGTSYAVGNALAKNSVGSAQIKAGAVQNSDIGKNAVAGGKVADNSLTGADIKESTLGTVPSASKVNGQGVYKVQYKSPAVAGTKTLLNAGGLQLIGSCVGGSVALVAKTTTNNSSIYTQVQTDATGNPIVEDDLESGAFTTSSNFSLLAGTPGNISIVTFVFEGANDVVANGSLVVDLSGGTNVCHVSGHVTVG